jgi:hypothetical protein
LNPTIDDKRHKLLGILTKQRINSELKKVEYNVPGVSFDLIYKELDCDDDELQLITSELYSSDEIVYYKADNVVGLFAKKKGKTAFSNNKYKRRISDRKKERVKFILPILAFVMSLASLYFSNITNILNSKFESENKELKDKIDTLEIQVNKLKLDVYNNPKEYRNKDTSNVVLKNFEKN